MATRVQVINEVSREEVEGSWNLCFQWCMYVYDNGKSEHGYRFIWRRPDGSLQPARGQARLPSIEVIEKLIDKARSRNWGDRHGDWPVRDAAGDVSFGARQGGS